MIMLSTAGLFFSITLLFVPLPLFIRIVLLGLIFISTVYSVLSTALLWLPWSWQALASNKAGEWNFTRQNGKSFVGYIETDSFVSAYLTILHVVPADYRWFKFWQHRYVLLLQDNTNTESFRKLRVHLLWRKSLAGKRPNLTTKDE